MEHILVVEDNPDLSEMICAYLSDAGYSTGVACDGIEALDRFRERRWDLILLDIMLPKIDGYGVCELIRRESAVPIILLTALDTEQDQLRGFELDIDDYITKPFSTPVLLRKIAVILKRTRGGASPGENFIKYKDISLDLDAYAAEVDGRILDLTSREFELLTLLLQNQGRVLTRSILLERLWNYDFLGDQRIVDSHIKNLRKKLDRDYIETVRGVGYRIERIN